MKVKPKEISSYGTVGTLRIDNASMLSGSIYCGTPITTCDTITTTR